MQLEEQGDAVRGFGGGGYPAGEGVGCGWVSGFEKGYLVSADADVRKVLG